MGKCHDCIHYKDDCYCVNCEDSDPNSENYYDLFDAKETK